MSNRVIPYLLYRDVSAALDWLGAAFGFTEVLRFTEDDGRVSHAEMDAYGDRIMLGGPGGDYRSPADLGQVTVGIHIYVDDVDPVFARATDAGATVLREPADQDYGDRNCMLADPEGHQWWFAQHLRDVTPEQWGASSTTDARTDAQAGAPTV